MKRSFWPALLVFLIVIVACQATDPLSPSPTSIPLQLTETVASPTMVSTDSPTADPKVMETEPPDMDTTPMLTSTSELEKESMPETDANADVEFVRAVRSADGTWTFHVTVRHPDTGWEDYADGWNVITAAGMVLKANEADPFTRLLLHPHENEQPFTRSQSGIAIPEEVNQVTVRAHDLVDGFGGREVTVILTSTGGSDFEVVHQ